MLRECGGAETKSAGLFLSEKAAAAGAARDRDNERESEQNESSSNDSNDSLSSLDSTAEEFRGRWRRRQQPWRLFRLFLELCGH